MTKYTRTEILDTAKQYVNKDRASEHGDMENNFESIAALWEIYFDNEWSFTSTDVAAMMALLKIARMKSNKSNPDNWIDSTAGTPQISMLPHQNAPLPCLKITSGCSRAVEFGSQPVAMGPSQRFWRDTGSTLYLPTYTTGAMARVA